VGGGRDARANAPARRARPRAAARAPARPRRAAARAPRQGSLNPSTSPSPGHPLGRAGDAIVSAALHRGTPGGGGAGGGRITGGGRSARARPGWRRPRSGAGGGVRGEGARGALGADHAAAPLPPHTPRRRSGDHRAFRGRAAAAPPRPPVPPAHSAARARSAPTGPPALPPAAASEGWSVSTLDRAEPRRILRRSSRPPPRAARAHRRAARPPRSPPRLRHHPSTVSWPTLPSWRRRTACASPGTCGPTRGSKRRSVSSPLPPCIRPPSRWRPCQ